MSRLARFFLATLSASGCHGLTDRQPNDKDTGGDTDTDTHTSDTDTQANTWQVVTKLLPGALLSVTGTSTSDVWTVGAEGTNGPEILHYDGQAWTKIHTDSAGDLWWVWEFSPTSVWLVGAGGRVLHGNTSGFTETVLDADVTLFGIWGSAEDDVWAIGGDIGRSANSAALWHFDGDDWTQATLPAAAAAQVAMYKVWGSSASDVWICGMHGQLAHFDGQDWESTDAGTTRDLFTVTGTSADNVYAVGGIGNGQIDRWDGSMWHDESPLFAPDLNGVAALGDQVVVVGRTGSVWHKNGAAEWAEDARPRATDKNLHATWIDPDGGVWAVGGQLNSPPVLGTLLYGGPETVAPYAP